MPIIFDIFQILGAFFLISLASDQVGRFFARMHLPKITGLLVVGILSGPFVFQMVSSDTVASLDFLFDISLAFIAFAAGSEIYLKELRSRFKSITWLTTGIMTITFVASSIFVYFIADFIPFMEVMSFKARLSLSLLIGVIFTASSPAAAIAIINEQRAKGPFTSTSIGVTLIKDVLVIILFTVCFSLAYSQISGAKFEYLNILVLFIELVVSILIGLSTGILLGKTFSFPLRSWMKSALTLLIGWGVFFVSSLIKEHSTRFFSHEVYLEPLLICIVASFWISNYSNYRSEFHKIISGLSTPIFVVFFTLTGASISLDVLVHSWFIALVLFFVRLVTLVLGTFAGGLVYSEARKINMVNWMPYVTQAGVALGLVMVVAGKYEGWGTEFATIMIAVIVLNQVFGPPLFKWAINFVGESHAKAPPLEFDGLNEALIIGYESQSVALAKQLHKNGWFVTIATLEDTFQEPKTDEGFMVIPVKKLNLESLRKLGAAHAEAIICMNTDEENYCVCELAYEYFGTKDLIVRLNDRKNFDRFHDLGVHIVDPFTAIVGLLDHLVRSPQATSLILGMEPEQDTVEIELRNPDMHGIALRDIRLPDDILILSVIRGEHFVLSHGYTRLRLGDLITVVGSKSGIEKVSLRFQ